MSQYDCPRPLTEDQRWVLDAICHTGLEWHRPMDIGRPTNFIWSGLRALERRGLVESKQRVGNGPNPARGSKLYRVTEAGRLANHRG